MFGLLRGRPTKRFGPVLHVLTRFSVITSRKYRWAPPALVLSRATSQEVWRIDFICVQ